MQCQWTQWQNVTRLNETDWKQQTRSDQIRPDWGILARPGYMDQTTYEPDQSTQTMSYGPDQRTQTGVYGPDHIWTRPKDTDQGIWTRPKYTDQNTWTRQDKTRPKYTDQGMWTRSNQIRPDQTRQTRLDQTRLMYTDQNQSRPKYIHQIRLYQRLLNPFSAWNNQHIYRETFQGSLRACLTAIFFITKFGDNSCIIEFKQSLKMSK